MIREIFSAALIFLWLLIASTEYARTPDPIWFSIAKCIALIAIALVLFRMFEPWED